MSTQPDPPKDYVRYVLWSAGFHPAEELVSSIYATSHPQLVVDSLLTALGAYPPTKKALDFINAMQEIVDGFSRTTLKERLNLMGGTDDEHSNSTD